MNEWEGNDAAAEARRFAELWGVEGTVLVDADGSLAERLGVRGVPTNVMVGADGVVTEVGAVTPDELEAATRRLLGPEAPIEPKAPPAGWHWQHEPEHLERHITAHSDRRR